MGGRAGAHGERAAQAGAGRPSLLLAGGPAAGSPPPLSAARVAWAPSCPHSLLRVPCSSVIKQSKFGPFPESLVAVYIQQVLQVGRRAG